jgi:hypothetical protein
VSKAEKILKKWLKNTPTEVPIDKVEAFLDRHFSGQYSQSSTSHIVVQDDKLKGMPDYGPNGDFTVVVKGGRKVKGVYLKRLAETVIFLQELNKEDP